MPGFASEAMDHLFSGEGGLMAAYVFIWNVLAMAVCSVPTTVVKEEEQYYETSWNDPISAEIKKGVQSSAGLPVGVQVVGLPFEEERVLGVAKQIETHFRFSERFQLPQ